MPTVVTLGEIMLRLSTPGFQRFVQAQTFDATYGGGEANVAVSAANYGHGARFVTKLPAHEVGQAALNHLRRHGVHTRFVVRGGDRLGVYFLETGASQRPSKVVYDRAGSAVSEMGPDEVDWDAAFDGADWFHFTGITAALGDTARRTLREHLAPIVTAAVADALPAVVRRAALPSYLTRHQLAELTGWSVRKVDLLRQKRRITYVRRGRTVLFATADVEAFLDEGRVEARSGALMNSREA